MVIYLSLTELIGIGTRTPNHLITKRTDASQTLVQHILF